MRLYKILFLILIISYSTIRANSDKNYIYQQVSLKEGLSQSTVKSILHDSFGNLWVGTQHGLNRINGSQIEQYFHSPSDSTSLPDNHILFIKEDNANNLWIGTNNSMVRYNPESNNFYKLPNENRNLLFRNAIILDDRIVFLASDRIVSIDNKTGSIDTKYYSGVTTRIPQAMRVEHLDDTTILIGSRWSGTFTLDTNTARIDSLNLLNSLNITALAIDSLDRIWISSYGEGLHAYSKEGKPLYRFNKSNSKLESDIILDLEIIDNNSLWIGTDGGGLSRIDLEKTVLSPEKINSINRGTPIANAITDIYQDSEKNIWIGSVRGGIYNLKQNFIESFSFISSSSEYGLSESTVTSFTEGSDGMIWIGTDGNGVNSFDPSTKKFKHYPSTFGNKITSLIPFSDDEILFSIFHEPIRLLNKKSGTTRLLPMPKDISRRIERGWVSVNLYPISESEFLILSDSIYLFEKRNNRLTTIKAEHSSGLRAAGSSNGITYLYNATNIITLDPTSKSVKSNYTHDISTHGNIATACCDNEGSIWVGSEKSTIKISPLGDIIETIKSDLFTMPTTLVPTSDNKLWIGASNKLFKYSLTEDKFTVYDKSDGVEPNEYISKAILISKQGTIYIGGVTGFQRLYNQEDTTISQSPNILLSNITVDGQKHKLEDVNKPIKLSPYNNSTQININIKDNAPLKEKHIRYQLKGLHKEWITTSNTQLSFFNLKPGEYKLYVQSILFGGGWSKAEHLATISVLPFWWQTWWFRVLLSLTILTFLYLLLWLNNKREARKVQEKLDRYQSELSEEKVKFLINVNHELRTPLTLISAPIARLLKAEDYDKDKIHDTLLKISKQVRQMRSVIDMVLDVRKIELNKDVVNRTHIRLNEFILSTLDEFRIEFESKGIELTYICNNSIDSLEIDKDKLHKVLTNILINSLKFSKNRGIVTVTSTLNSEKLRVTIEDQGIGIDLEDTNHIFEEFQQAKHDKGGSGIGLSYCKTLIEIQGGSIGCFNNEDQGATFWFEIPISQASNTNEKIEGEDKSTNYEISTLYPEEYPPIESGILSRYSILVVEDQQELREMIVIEMQKLFATVYSAANGVEALKVTKDQMPNIIISDVMMPQMDGLELCKCVKSDMEISHIPIILLTARADSKSLEMGYKMGADAYLAKPFEFDSLISLLYNTLRNRELLREKFKATGFALLPEEVTTSSADEEFLKQLLEIIQQEISNVDLDVMLLADKMAMSRSTLYAKMKSITGTGIKDFINELRIKQAMLLLIESDTPIVEISERVGFSQQRYFSTVFKQHTQMTPTEYRKANRSN
ncbi:MAG: two-component regulator propeller domain-containing protein [Bacteroidales bacterium]